MKKTRDPEKQGKPSKRAAASMVVVADHDRPEIIQGRPLSERFAPRAGWTVSRAIWELQCLLDGLDGTWEEAGEIDEIVGNRIFSIYYGAKRLLDDIEDLHYHELKRARGDGQDEHPISAVK